MAAPCVHDPLELCHVIGVKILGKQISYRRDAFFILGDGGLKILGAKGKEEEGSERFLGFLRAWEFWEFSESVSVYSNFHSDDVAQF